MKTPKNKQNAVKRIFAVFSAFLILATVFCVSASADDVTSFGGYTPEANFTILYNADVDITSGWQTWTYTPVTEFQYTDIYLCIVYTAVTPTNGVMTISQGEESASISLDNFTQGQGYRVATAYIDNFTLTDSLDIIIDYFGVFDTPDIRIEYVLVSHSVDEIHLYEVAEFMAYNENDVAQFNQLFLRTIADNSNGYLDRGLSQGFAQGYQNGYNEGYTEGYDNGHNVGYNEAMDRYLDIGYQNGYNEGYDIGYDVGYTDGSDGIGLEKLPFAITDSIANMFVSITNFEILGVNVLGLLGSLISIVVVAFVIKKVF